MWWSRRSRIFAVVAGVAAGLGGGVSGGASQESVGATELEPCRARCGLTLVPEREYGDDSGPGMIEAASARAWLDASGRAYVVGTAVPHVWVFGPDGSFLARIGRSGSGPGEFRNIGSLVVTDDGVFSVLDRGRGTIMTFDWTGELRREVRTQGWLPMGFQTIPFEGDLALHTADIRTPDQVGYPIRVVDLATGAIRESFGSRTGEYPLGSMLEQRSLARGPGRSVWMARIGAYEIELWERNTVVRALRREVEWFPQIPRDQHGHGMEEKPSPVFAHMVSLDSLLWVFLYTADDRWAEAAATRDRDLFHDTVVEVIDWSRGRIVASRRLDEYYTAWLEPGLIGRLATTEAGSVRYLTYRVQLEAGDPEGPTAW